MLDNTSTEQTNNKGVYLWKKDSFFCSKNFYLNDKERLNHTYILGKKDSWKEKTIINLMIQDIQNGKWICVIDQNWEYSKNLLKFIPKERARDLIYFDPSEEERTMWLNLYDINTIDQASDVTELASEMFIKMYWPEIFWPRIQEYFKYGSLTILEDFDDRPTLLDVVRLFTDDAYRELKVAKVTNAVVRNWWERTYNSMGDREKAEIIPYFSSKFVSFMTNIKLRHIIGQTKSAFDFTDVINNNKILLINLAKNKIGEMGDYILWTILSYKLKIALAKGTKNHNSFNCYINNFQNYLWAPYEERFNKASNNNVAFTLIQDFTEQNSQKDFKKNLLDIINNTWNIFIFNTFTHDAEFFEKEVSKNFNEKTIENLKENQFIFKSKALKKPIKINGYKKYFAPSIEDIVPLLQEYCSKKYGRNNIYIEAEQCIKFWLDVEIKEIKNEKWEKIEELIYKEKNNKKIKKINGKEIKETTSKKTKKTTK